MNRSVLLIIVVLAVLAALFYFSQSSGGSSSCGCNKSRDPVYLDDPATNLNTPDEYRDEFLNSGLPRSV
jgi:hypothetical protein